MSEKGVKRSGGDSGRDFSGEITGRWGDDVTQVRWLQAERRGERAGEQRGRRTVAREGGLLQKVK